MEAYTMGVWMIVDATITIGNIIEISVIAAGGLAAIITIKNTVGNMKADITDMKAEIKKVGDVLIQLAVQEQRMSNVEQDIRELKHGRGFIQDEIRGEYPRT